MNNYKKDIAIIGLGYVGLPLAVEFSRYYNVVGYDVNKNRIEELRNGFDSTQEIIDVGMLKSKKLLFSNEKEDVLKSNIYVITVPTPVDKNNVPDLSNLKDASKLVGLSLEKKNIVIYESTVFPGATEQICVPILEKTSGLVYNEDFFCGYSPERINPGDKKHKLNSIIKITSGSNKLAEKIIDDLYSTIIKAGTFLVSSIKVAEAAKIIENTQRDLNIALVNELSLIFDKLNIDTKEVLEAAKTKWNFLNFKPGLVGGHCIGVDPYYLTHKALEIGYHPEIILAGRRINEQMPKFIVEKTLSELASQGVSSINAKIAILGITFKEDCPDLRNSKVKVIFDLLKNYNCKVSLIDYCADNSLVKSNFGVDLKEIDDIKGQDAIILAVNHVEYLRLTIKNFKRILNRNGLIIDVKSSFNKKYFSKTNFRYWRL